MTSDGSSIPAAGERPRRIRGRAAHTTLRSLLLAGFAAIVTIWVAAGIDVLLRFQDADQQLRDFTTRFLQTEEDLSTIRTGVFLGAREGTSDESSEFTDLAQEVTAF